MKKEFERKILELGSVETRKYSYRSWYLADDDGLFHRITRFDNAKWAASDKSHDAFENCTETVKEIRVPEDAPIKFYWGDIANALMDEQSFENDDCYYLSMMDNQDIVFCDCRSADVVFTAKRDLDDMPDDYDIQDIYDTEDINNKVFTDCVDSLYFDALDYFKSL